MKPMSDKEFYRIARRDHVCTFHISNKGQHLDGGSTYIYMVRMLHVPEPSHIMFKHEAGKLESPPDPNGYPDLYTVCVDRYRQERNPGEEDTQHCNAVLDSKRIMEAYRFTTPQIRIVFTKRAGYAGPNETTTAYQEAHTGIATGKAVIYGDDPTGQITAMLKRESEARARNYMGVGEGLIKVEPLGWAAEGMED